LTLNPSCTTGSASDGLVLLAVRCCLHLGEQRTPPLLLYLSAVNRNVIYASISDIRRQDARGRLCQGVPICNVPDAAVWRAFAPQPVASPPRQVQ
jgi:hypothetical protein